MLSLLLPLPPPQEELRLTPQQEQTLEAHQALFEQRAAALEDSKAAVLAAIADAAAKGDGADAALELLQARRVELTLTLPAVDVGGWGGGGGTLGRGEWNSGRAKRDTSLELKPRRGKASALVPQSHANTHACIQLTPTCLQGAAALRASLKQDMLVKAPVMISLRKVRRWQRRRGWQCRQGWRSVLSWPSAALRASMHCSGGLTPAWYAAPLPSAAGADAAADGAPDRRLLALLLHNEEREPRAQAAAPGGARAAPLMPRHTPARVEVRCLQRRLAAGGVHEALFLEQPAVPGGTRATLHRWRNGPMPPP